MNLKKAFDTRHRGAMIKHDHFFDIYDSHLSHLKEFDEKNTSMEFLKSLTDKLNCWAYREDDAQHLKKEGELDKYEKGLWGMPFYDSIVFVNKFPRPSQKSFGDDVWYPHIDENKEYYIDPNTRTNGYGVKF